MGVVRVSEDLNAESTATILSCGVLLCGVLFVIFGLFKGFRASLDLASTRERENVTATGITIKGVYKINRDDLSTTQFLPTQSYKKVTPDMVKLPFSYKKDDTDNNNYTAKVSSSTSQLVDQVIDDSVTLRNPRAQQSTTASVSSKLKNDKIKTQPKNENEIQIKEMTRDEKIKAKVEKEKEKKQKVKLDKEKVKAEKNKAKLEKEREKEKAKQEKEKAKQDLLRNKQQVAEEKRNMKNVMDREINSRQKVSEKSKKTKVDNSKSKKGNLASTSTDQGQNSNEQPPPLPKSPPPAIEDASGTFDSLSSAPPPYEQFPPAKTPSEMDVSGNTTFGPSAQGQNYSFGGSWDMVAQHKQAVKTKQTKPRSSPLQYQNRASTIEYNVGGFVIGDEISDV